MDASSIRKKISIIFQNIDYYAFPIIENVLMSEVMNKEKEVNAILKEIGLG